MTLDDLDLPAAEVRALKAVLRAHGLRATHARIAVLAIVRAARRPLSLADIVRIAPHLTPQRRTLHSSLGALLRAGLLARTGSTRPARFIAAEPLGEHA